MIQVFYKSKGQIATTSDVKELTENLGFDDVLWIDLYEPSAVETKSVEEFLETTLQSRAQAEEIESSSRYSETDTAIFANTDFISPGPDSYSEESVSFVVSEGVLVTTRQAPLRTFTEFQRRMVNSYKLYPTGYHIFVAIMENRVDLDADMIEVMAKEIEKYGQNVNVGAKVNEDFLLDINQMQENTMMVRENIVDKQRIVTAVLRSDKFPSDIRPRLEVLVNDIVSLLNHTNFNFERLEYLQNTVLGLINLEQNKIMRILTFVSLLFMPPTLISGIFGMNVNLPIFGENFRLADFCMILFIMLLSVLVASILFRHRRITK
ncbi:MAG: magnesium and cobalt transport protein CorA [Bacteroidales bacterium]|jgi:magnesium transporter|nr:magnesium and cobalt transport protein CorA [Bacteroidales bacterium]